MRERTHRRTALFLAFAAPAHADFTVTPASPQAGSPRRRHDPRRLRAIAGERRAAPAARPGRQSERGAEVHAGASFEAGTCPERAPASATRDGEDPLIGLPIPASGTCTTSCRGRASRPRSASMLGFVGRPASATRRRSTLRPDGGLDSTIAPLESGGLDLAAARAHALRHVHALPDVVHRGCRRRSQAPVPNDARVGRRSRRPAARTCRSTRRSPRRSRPPSAPSRAARPSRSTLPAEQTRTCKPRGDRAARRHHALARRRQRPAGVHRRAVRRRRLPGGLAGRHGQLRHARCSAPLAGKVYFGDGFRLYIVVAGQGVPVEARRRRASSTPRTGQITTIFDNLPQVPFTTFALTFQGGSHAVLANPPTCGTQEPERRC